MAAREQDQEGAVALEFALIAPILILLFFGIIYFGLTIFRLQVVESATREAARAMAVGADAATVESVLDATSPTFGDSELNVTAYRRDGVAATVASGDDPCDGSTRNATIIAGVPSSVTRFDFSIPFGSSYTPDFSATATFRCEV